MRELRSRSSPGKVPSTVSSNRLRVLVQPMSVYVDNAKNSYLYSLTLCQEKWLRDAANTEGGAYVGLTAGPEPDQLVDGGAATYREVRQISGSRGVHDSKPCEWSDMYLVPTTYGLELLMRSRTSKTSR